jgi:Holliday junction resolvase
MGKMSRDKGALFERALVNSLRERGFEAERVPLSGAAHGSFAGDVQMPLLGVVKRWEAKIRADGFKELYRWLAGHAGLFLRADRRETLVVLRMDDFCELVARAEGRTTVREMADEAA